MADYNPNQFDKNATPYGSVLDWKTQNTKGEKDMGDNYDNAQGDYGLPGGGRAQALTPFELEALKEAAKDASSHINKLEVEYAEYLDICNSYVQRLAKARERYEALKKYE